MDFTILTAAHSTRKVSFNKVVTVREKKGLFHNGQGMSEKVEEFQNSFPT